MEPDVPLLVQEKCHRRQDHHSAAEHRSDGWDFSQEEEAEDGAVQNGHLIVDAQFAGRGPAVGEGHGDLSDGGEDADHQEAEEIPSGGPDKGRQHQGNGQHRAECAEVHHHRQGIDFSGQIGDHRVGNCIAKSGSERRQQRNAGK